MGKKPDGFVRRGNVFQVRIRVDKGYCQVVFAVSGGSGFGMKILVSMPRLKGFRFPREIVACAVRACHRFAPGTADAEDLLAGRGVPVSRESVRHRVNRSGPPLADCIRRDRPPPRGKWHPDEAVILIGGSKHWLWRAVDAAGSEDIKRVRYRTARHPHRRGMTTFHRQPRNSSIHVCRYGHALA